MPVVNVEVFIDDVVFPLPRTDQIDIQHVSPSNEIHQHVSELVPHVLGAGRGHHRSRFLRRQPLEDLTKLADFADKGHSEVLRRVELIPIANCGKVCSRPPQNLYRVASNTLASASDGMRLCVGFAAGPCPARERLQPEAPVIPQAVLPTPLNHNPLA